MSGATKCFFCVSKFGLFKKQYQCSGCGYAACKDCLPHKLPTQPQAAICRKCFKDMNRASASGSSGRISPPANFKREMAEKAAQQQQQQQVSVATMDIAQRLEKLKQDMKSSDVSVDELERRVSKLRMTSSTRDNDVTFEEIEARLNTLKGKKPPVIRVLSMKRKFDDGNQSGGPSPSRDTEDEQVKRLIRQYTSDSISDDVTTADDLIADVTTQVQHEQQADDVIAARNRNLLEGIDDESAALIRKLIAEQEIEDNAIAPSSGTAAVKKDEAQEEEELPWCFMCNDDAVTKCMTCEDLYCRPCFNQVHNEEGMGGHRTKPFTNSKS